MLTLGGAGVAVRSLEQTRGPLETMFFALTEGDGQPGDFGAAEAAP